jgi:5-methylcytosine-specific restriction endonuclease McrA
MPSKAYYAAHREERIAATKAYQEAHPERRKAWLEANRELNRAKRAVWYAANREAQHAYNVARYAGRRDELLAESKAYYEAHGDEIRARARSRYDPVKGGAKNAAYRATRPDKARERDSRNHARRRGAAFCAHPGCLALGPAALAWQTNPHRCYLCGTVVWEGVNLHMDHVVPIARGGVHCAENLRPTCATCNLKKHARTLGEYEAAAS